MFINNSQSQSSYAYAEILEILSLIDKELVRKIPKKILKIFQTNASTTYTKHLDKTIPLEEQTISQKTASIFTLLALKYWNLPEDEINSIKLILTENEIRLKKELEEKYSPSNIFNTTNIQNEKNNIVENITSTIETNNTLPLDTENLPWYKKIIIKFNKLFSNKTKKSNNPT